MFTLNLPERYNASTSFLDNNLEAGRGSHPAVFYQDTKFTYAEIAAQVNRAGNAMHRLGIQMEQRVMLALFDSPEFIACFFGAIRAGIVPVPVNTMLTTHDYEYLLNDSRAQVLIVSQPLYEHFAPILPHLKWLKHIIVVGEATPGTISYSDWVNAESPDLSPADTTPDDACFWLYSSGTTGFPKGAVHLQHDMLYAAKHYTTHILNLHTHDRMFSVAKLFFAYGLGNSMYFPFFSGASTILHPGAPTPQAAFEIITRAKPTLFFGVPTAYAHMLTEDISPYDLSSLRLCISAGEALPVTLYQKWHEKTKLEILDGIGSTEGLHIFISNQANQVRPGSSGKAVIGYEAKIVDDHGIKVGQGEVGNLTIKGDSICAYYWNKHEKTKHAVVGEWLHTGDKYILDQDGYFWHQGRSDDMLKIGGIWVSPTEIEGALMAHADVLECAVIGKKDSDNLVKVKAFIVLKPQNNAPSSGEAASLPDPVTAEKLKSELKEFVKDTIAPYKHPHWIEFVTSLPKTATGKIQRFKLRQHEESH
jgi:benzoate-CoA ligase